MCSKCLQFISQHRCQATFLQSEQVLLYIVYGDCLRVALKAKFKYVLEYVSVLIFILYLQDKVSYSKC